MDIGSPLHQNYDVFFEESENLDQSLIEYRSDLKTKTYLDQLCDQNENFYFVPPKKMEIYPTE